jgi:hypothetical protein
MPTFSAIACTQPNLATAHSRARSVCEWTVLNDVSSPDQCPKATLDMPGILNMALLFKYGAPPFALLPLITVVLNGFCHLYQKLSHHKSQRDR